MLSPSYLIYFYQQAYSDCILYDYGLQDSFPISILADSNSWLWCLDCVDIEIIHNFFLLMLLIAYNLPPWKLSQIFLIWLIMLLILNQILFIFIVMPSRKTFSIFTLHLILNSYMVGLLLQVFLLHTLMLIMVLIFMIVNHAVVIYYF